MNSLPLSGKLSAGWRRMWRQLARTAAPRLAHAAIWVPLIIHPVKNAPTHELLRAALKEPDPVTRERALEALGLIRDPADAGQVRALLNAELEATRQQAAQTAAVLGLSLTPEQRAAATHIRPQEPSPVASLVQAVGNSDLRVLVHSLRSLDAEAARQNSALLLPLLSRSAIVVQEEAVRAIQRGKLAAAAPDLIVRLNDADEGLRLASCEALAAVFDNVPRPALTSAMVRRLELDLSAQVRRTAGLTLVALHDGPAREALVALLKHKRGMTRASAAWTLGAWGDAQLATALHPLLVDPEDLVARSAAAALGQLKSASSKAPLLEALLTRNPLVQERIAWALGEHKSTEAVPAMMQRLATLDEDLKTSLVLALGKTADKRMLPALRRVLHDIPAYNNLPRARAAALTALTALNDKAALPRAIQIIATTVVPPVAGGSPSFDEDFVRIAALRLASVVGDKKTGATLLTAIDSHVPREMRPAVAEALTKLLGQTYQPISDEDFRTYFVESLATRPREAVPLPGARLAP